MALVASTLSKGTKPEAINKKRKCLAVEELFISPPGHSKKCRYTLWKEHKKGIHASQAQSLKNIVCATPKGDRVIHAVKGWTWPLNRDRWRNTDGQVVPLERLKLAEFLSAIFAIRAANFPTIFPTISWTKKLTPPEFTYVYPASELAVGIKLAKQKMEDMQDEAVGRNILQ